MRNHQHFNVENNLNDLFIAEEISLPDDFKEKLISLISIFPIYEEEEMKIFPNVILGNNLSDSLGQLRGTGHFLTIAEDNFDAKAFSKKMKTLLPFCNTGWHVFIDVNTEQKKIYYGLARNYTGVSGFNLREDIFDKIEDPLKMIFIETIDKKSIFLRGVKSELLIDFRLFEDINSLDDSAIPALCKDLVADIKNDAEEIEKAFQKFFYMAQRKIHGTILLVVESNIVEIPDSLKDGNWFKDNFIDLSTSINSVLIESGNNRLDIEKHYSLTGVLISMLNIDGITVMNSKGQIIAYNVFLKQTSLEEVEVIGGARTRTALSLKNLDNEKFRIKGIYFQSQDGNKEYERVCKLNG